MAESFPKIGIRPVVDARRGGVRESLDGQATALARAAARLLEDNLRYPDGRPVRCIVTDTIGGAAEAARAADTFAREGVGVSLSVTPCWCYGAETIDMDPLTPKAIWGFNGTERPGAVYLAAALAAHNQKGLPAFGIYGRDVQDAGDTFIPDDVRRKLLTFGKAGLATAMMRGKSYLSVGGVSMGIAGSIVDPGLFERYLGMRVEPVDMVEILRRIDRRIYDEDEYRKALDWVKRNFGEGRDTNPPVLQASRQAKDAEWEFVVKTAVILRDLMVGNLKLADMGYGEEAEGHNAIAGGFQGQRQWTDHYPCTDFAETMLNTSFDWNGPRRPLVLATENDSLNAVAMLFGHLLTGASQLFADVRTYWSPDAVARVTGTRLEGVASGGVIHLMNSGPAALDATGQETLPGGDPVMKPFWELGDDDVKRCVQAVKWHPAVRGYFRAGGFSVCFVTRGGMPVTMSRLNLVDGVGPVLQLAEGYTVDLPGDVSARLIERTDPTWPTTWFVPNLSGSGAFRDVYSVMSNWGANHAAVAYGHIGPELMALASTLRIPVTMHNVAEDRILRPSVWGAFGSPTSVDADFRACRTYGPLYGRRD